MLKTMFNRRNLIVVGVFLSIILILYAYINIKVINDITNIVIIAGIIAYVLKPIRDFLMDKVGLSKRISTFVILIAITALFIGFISYTIPMVIKEMDNIGEVFNRLNTYFIELENKLRLNNSTIILEAYTQIQQKVWRFLSELSYDSLEIIIEGSQNILSYIIIPIIGYYLLSDGDSIGNKFYMLIPIEKRNLTKKILKDIDVLLQRYIVSQIILCGVTTVLSFIVFVSLGIRFPLLLAVVNGVFNIVPYFGAFFGGLPAVFIAFLESPSLALWTIVGIIIVQQIEGNVIAPKITADSTDLHPLLIILLLIIGEKLGGVIGMIFIIPIAVIIKVVHDDINYYIF